MYAFLLFKLLKVLKFLTKSGSGHCDYLLCCVQICNNNLIFSNCIGQIIKSYYPETLCFFEIALSLTLFFVASQSVGEIRTN